ncbi:hypothetical protein [Hymenobacter algoricola]|uniref:Uncharacterized protein n=1 Tax=Hymenobacter algoricola TaxID=486267 RepID=A0ABP7NTC9_9BACT
MNLLASPPISVTHALSGKRIRISELQEGAQLCAPILGFWRYAGGFTVYLAGTMPANLRTAAEEGRESEEVIWGDITSGILEVELEHCRHEFRVLPAPQGKIIPLFGIEPSLSEAA